MGEGAVWVMSHFPRPPVSFSTIPLYHAPLLKMTTERGVPPMSTYKSKQMIVMRRDLKMRKG